MEERYLGPDLHDIETLGLDSLILVMMPAAFCHMEGNHSLYWGCLFSTVTLQLKQHAKNCVYFVCFVFTF